jgi:hypothetical protein
LFGGEGPRYNSLGNLPKLNFSSFDGENPKLWQKRCEDYFHIYVVDPSVWIRVATMQFTGPAARWWQSVEYRAPTMSWGEFGSMILERFGKDQHQWLLRQLFHIRQTSSVTAYVDEFFQLVDKLNAYQVQSDPLYYTMKFVDGLRDDIKAVVMLQRPHDLDTTTVLAQLQVEASTLMRKGGSKWPDSNVAFKSRQAFGPTHTSRELKSPIVVKPDEKHAGVPSTSSTDDRIASLYAYHKAKGLCYKCGQQYIRGHHCSETVQLHVVEELWQMIQCSDSEECQVESREEEPEINALHLSQAAVDGTDAVMLLVPLILWAILLELTF